MFTDGYFTSIFRQQCILCGDAASARTAICHSCRTDLPEPAQACRRCAVELGGEPPDHGICGQCLLDPPSFDTCIPLLRYAFPAPELIASFKFHAQFAEGRMLAELLADRLLNHYGAAPRPQALLPVPLHPDRLRERGFNQSAELARVLGKRCRIPVVNDYCLRSRSTPSQKGLTAEERAVNLRNAFSLSERLYAAPWQHLAIVDDVVTTMTTVNSIARLLRKQGHRRIDVLCLARVS